MCLLSFAGFIRISELLNIRRPDMIFNEDHISLFIEKSKTDCFREGSSVIIARTDEVACPVRMLTRYLQIANISELSQEYLFTPISYCKKKYSYVLRGEKSISYSRARDTFKKALQEIGLENSKFG